MEEKSERVLPIDESNGNCFHGAVTGNEARVSHGLVARPREAHAVSPTMVHRSYVSFHFALSCGSDSCLITLLQSRYCKKACVTLDPHDFLSERAFTPLPDTASCLITCIVCRINYSFGNNGLGEGRKLVRCVPLGVMKMCRVYKCATSASCGVFPT